MQIFAKDTFKSGGDLIYRGGVFEMRDKVAHYLAGAIIAFIIESVTSIMHAYIGIDVPLVARVATALVIFVGWELLEFYRFWRNSWQYGVATDYISWRDVVADIGGALTAAMFLYRF